MGMGGGEDFDHLGLTARGDDEVGGEMVHARLQDRRIPEEVAALGAD
jgi:hypothetical protein